ncbi:MAG: YicC family protein [Victivallaceae bacterium]|nr:YicC family protein [Victivallaceae bacterium]
MLSMTGFGKAEGEISPGSVLSLEIASVNRKQFELRCNLPPEFSSFENGIRQRLSGVISRGSVSLRGTWHRGENHSSAIRVDQELLRALVENCRAVRKACQLDENVNVEALVSAPGVISGNAFDPDAPGIEEAFFAVLDAALARYQKMRAVEGEALKQDTLKRLQLLRETLEKIEPIVAKIPELQKQRILGKLKAERIPVPAADEQLLREVLFYADHADVTEEITRLKSHFGQFQNFLQSDRPVGRSMDFLIQESFREITTLGNKAGGVEVSPLLVLFKSELEKLREQIQNVE